MKKTALVMSLAFAAGLASAQEKKAAEPQKAARRAAPSHASGKSATAAKPNELGAELVSADMVKKTLTFKNEKGESLTWPAEGKAFESLKSLKAGDKVTIVYRAGDKGVPQAAIEIRPAAAAKVSDAVKPVVRAEKTEKK